MQSKTYNLLEERMRGKIAILSQQELDDAEQRGILCGNMGAYKKF